MLSTRAASCSPDHSESISFWLQKLGDCWRKGNVSKFSYEFEKAFMLQEPLSTKELQDVAAAIEQAHFDAIQICTTHHYYAHEASLGIRRGIDSQSSVYPFVHDGSSDNLERMQRLRAAGLLDALQDEAAVKYFQSAKAYYDCKRLQVGLNDHIVGRSTWIMTEPQDGEWSTLLERMKSKVKTRAGQWQAGEDQAAQDSFQAVQQAKLDAMRQVGLPAEYPSSMLNSSIQTWKPGEIAKTCAAADEANFRTWCNKTLSEFIYDTCRVSPTKIASDQGFSAAAKTVLEAYYVFMQARALAPGVWWQHIFVLCGDRRSQSEQILLSGIEGIIRIMAGKPSKRLSTMLLMGTSGTGKSPLLFSIREIMAMIEFANPDTIICTAYIRIRSPMGMVPHAYIADAMQERGILTGDDGLLPAWCNIKCQMDAQARQAALQIWIDGYRLQHGKQLIPALLIDEMGSLNRGPQEVNDRFLLHLHAMVEHEGSTFARFTGDWNPTSELLQSKVVGGAALYRAIPKQEIQRMTVTAEAQLMCLQGYEGSDQEPAVAISRAIAKRMLEDDRLVLLRKHGFLSPFPLTDTGESIRRRWRFLITLDDAKRWREAEVDWDKQAMDGEERVEKLRHATGGNPRYLLWGRRNAHHGLTVERLYDDLKRPKFIVFARWLVRELIRTTRGYELFELSENDFVKAHVVVTDAKVLESLRQPVLDQKSFDSCVDTDPSDEDLVFSFLDHYTGRGHIVTEMDTTTDPPTRYVRFSSKMVFRIVNAQLNDVHANLSLLEGAGVFGTRTFFSAEPFLGLAAEGLALNGLRLLGERVGLEGTMGLRRLDCDAWMRSVLHTGPDGQQVRDQVRLERLRVDAVQGDEIPLNTVLKETCIGRKADLIAVCVADGSDEAVVIRARAKTGKKQTRGLVDAKAMVASWNDDSAGGRPSVLSSLRQASNLQHIKTWTHVPVWLSPAEPLDKHAIERTGVRVVSGDDYWRMAIPVVRLAANDIRSHSHEVHDDEWGRLQQRIQRPPIVYGAQVRARHVG